jgi:hypothetical protein
VEIPRAVRLACYALSAGVEDFDGTSRAAKAAEAGVTEVTDLKKTRHRNGIEA